MGEVQGCCQFDSSSPVPAVRSSVLQDAQETTDDCYPEARAVWIHLKKN